MEMVVVKCIFLGSENYHIDVCSTSKEMKTHFDFGRETGHWAVGHEPKHSRSTAHDN